MVKKNHKHLLMMKMLKQKRDGGEGKAPEHTEHSDALVAESINEFYPQSKMSDTFNQSLEQIVDKKYPQHEIYIVGRSLYIDNKKIGELDGMNSVNDAVKMVDIALSKSDINEGEEGDPFKDKTKDKGMSTEDSDQADGDRVDNKEKHEKVDSHNSHYDTEMAHKEEKGEELKDKPSKKDVVAEGDKPQQPESDPFKDKKTGEEKHSKAMVAEEDDLSTADSEIEDSDNLGSESGSPIVKEDDAGEDELEAATQAMDDLEIDVANDSEEEPDAPVDQEPPAPAPDAEAGGEADIDVDAAMDAAGEEGSEETDVDVDVDAGGEEAGGDGETETAFREVKKDISDIEKNIDSHDYDDDKEKDIVNSTIHALDSALDGFSEEDLDDVIKQVKDAAQGDGEEGGEAPAPDMGGEDEIGSEVSGLDKGSDDAIDVKINDLKSQGQDDTGEEEADVDVDIEESHEECSECGSFQQYAESRGYTMEELMECGHDEKANVVSGYANAYKDGMNDGDFENIAVIVDDDVMGELGDYGHSDFAEELTPFVQKVQEAGVSYGKTEPMLGSDPSDFNIEEDDEANPKDRDMERTDISQPWEADQEPEQVQAFKQAMQDMGYDAGKLDQLSDEETRKVFNMVDQMVQEKNNAPVEEESESAGFGGVAQNLGAGSPKPSGEGIQYEDVQMSESEKKIRKYVQQRLAEMTGKKKQRISESKKSPKLKALDKMIREQFDLYGKEFVKKKSSLNENESLKQKISDLLTFIRRDMLSKNRFDQRNPSQSDVHYELTKNVADVLGIQHDTYGGGMDLDDMINQTNNPSKLYDLYQYLQQVKELGSFDVMSNDFENSYDAEDNLNIS